MPKCFTGPINIYARAFEANLLAGSKAEATLQHSKDALECESKAFAFGPRNSYAEVFHWPDQHIYQGFRGKPVCGFES